MDTTKKLIEDVEREITRLQKVYEKDSNIYYYGQIDAYSQALSRLKGL